MLNSLFWYCYFVCAESRQVSNAFPIWSLVSWEEKPVFCKSDTKKVKLNNNIISWFISICTRASDEYKQQWDFSVFSSLHCVVCARSIQTVSLQVMPKGVFESLNSPFFKKHQIIQEQNPSLWMTHCIIYSVD